MKNKSHIRPVIIVFGLLMFFGSFAIGATGYISEHVCGASGHENEHICSLFSQPVSDFLKDFS